VCALCEKMHYCSLECLKTHWVEDHAIMCPRDSVGAAQFIRDQALEAKCSEVEMREALLRENARLRREREKEKDKDEEAIYLLFQTVLEDHTGLLQEK